MPTPAAEIDIDEGLVRSLLEEQYPQLAGEEIHIAGNGWDNVIARAGDRVVRLPRRAQTAALIESELRWLPVLAGRLPLPVPVPEFAGRPSAKFPWSWSVARWLPGRAASVEPPDDLTAAAEDLAGFIVALHRPAPEDAPVSAYRGGPLKDRAEAVRKRAGDFREVIDQKRVLTLWEILRATPEWQGPALWLHGDLHPSNLLTYRGRLSGVIDFGDLTRGDPATDLAVAWMLFGKADRDVIRRMTATSDNTWRRSAGWALHLSLAYMTGDEHTEMPAIGRRTLTSVLEEFS
jgi:aminoglycoside phosphotransferase (APT) family kinase protein